MIAALKGQATVLFSTHLLDDAEKICDRVGILHNGKVITEGPLDHLLKGTNERLHLVVSPSASDGSSNQSELQSAIAQTGWVIDSTVPENRSLEEVFIAATGDEQ